MSNWIGGLERIACNSPSRGLTRRRGDRAGLGEGQDVKDAMFGYLAERNSAPKRYVWKAQGEEILAKIRQARERLDGIIKGI
jgi:hypothetical protein